MTFNWWTFLFQVLNFVVLAYALHRLLYRPLRGAIERRREAAAQAQADAEKARDQAETLRQQLQAQQAELEQERQGVIRTARGQAEAERRKLLAAADATLRQRHEEAQQALERERAEALTALRGEVVGQALDLTRLLLREAADRTLDRQLVLHLVEELRALPDAERERLRAQWQPADGALLETVGELDAETLRKVTEAVAAVVGQPVELVVRARPELLGGARLRLAGQVWDGSLAGQLEDDPQDGAA